MRDMMKNLTYLMMASLGAAAFWGGLGGVHQMANPHPGLKDDALQAALRKNHNHKPVSYVEARRLVFGKIDGNGSRADCVYTGETIKYIGQPIANNGAVEHAWPLTRLPQGARSDLHHLFPVQGEARLARLNLRYGRVVVPVWSQGGSRSGPGPKVKPVFEVRDEARGDMARAMFYVATMYELDIPADEEKVLRTWHRQDPVSQAERDRNDKVARHQTSRNPFVDHPSLVGRIQDF